MLYYATLSKLMTALNKPPPHQGEEPILKRTNATTQINGIAPRMNEERGIKVGEKNVKLTNI